MTDFPRGRFVWHELYTTDTAAARQFYQRVTGWGVQDFPMEGMDSYTMWMNGETPVGGMMVLPEQARQMGAPPHWLGYISTPDVDATWAEAQKRGATNIMGPHTAASVGRWVILKDPQGALVAFFKSETPSSGPLTAPGMGDFSWHELATTDLDAATRFYTDLFGWETTDFDMGEFGVYRIFLVEGQQIGGMFRKPDDMPAPPHWLHYTRVDNADAAAGRVTDAGGKILNGPMDVPGGDRIVQCMDPQGAAFALQSTPGNQA
ncbi:MAG TPA: VOC family protein [Longimicrobiales bacterium]